MDPNDTLRELRELADRAARGAWGAGDEDELTRLLELWNALDDWLDRGGVLPEAWRDAQHPPLQVRIVVENVDPDWRPGWPQSHVVLPPKPPGKGEK